VEAAKQSVENQYNRLVLFMCCVQRTL